MPRGKSPFLILLAGGVLVLLACAAVLRDRIAVAYHVHRLKTGKETLRGILAKEPTRIEAEALHAFLRTPRGLEDVVTILLEEVVLARTCDGVVTGTRRALLWLRPDGHLLGDVICADSSHIILSWRGEDPSFRRRLQPFLSRASRVERRRLEEPRMTVSVLPLEEGVAAFFAGLGTDPDKMPDPGEGAGTMAVFLEKVDRPANPR
jgi:hypothetical protein